MLKGLEAETMHLLPLTDVMGQRQVVVSLGSHILPNCGYNYIHEDGLFEGKALARAHHHFRIVCDLYLPSSISEMKHGNESIGKSRKMGMQPLMSS